MVCGFAPGTLMLLADELGFDGRYDGAVQFVLDQDYIVKVRSGQVAGVTWSVRDGLKHVCSRAS